MSKLKKELENKLAKETFDLEFGKVPSNHDPIMEQANADFIDEINKYIEETYHIQYATPKNPWRGDE